MDPKLRELIERAAEKNEEARLKNEPELTLVETARRGRHDLLGDSAQRELDRRNFEQELAFQTILADLRRSMPPQPSSIDAQDSEIYAGRTPASVLIFIGGVMFIVLVISIFFFGGWFYDAHSPKPSRSIYRYLGAVAGPGMLVLGLCRLKKYLMSGDFEDYGAAAIVGVLIALILFGFETILHTTI